MQIPYYYTSSSHAVKKKQEYPAHLELLPGFPSDFALYLRPEHPRRRAT